MTRRTPEQSRAAAAAALRETVDRLRDEIVDAVSEVIRIPSITPNYPGLRPEDHIGGEGEVSRALGAHMAAAGLEVDVFGVVPGRENAIGVRPGAGPRSGRRPRIGYGRSLILNGHVDVVPPGPAHEWSDGDPWSGRVANGRVYGRGAADMKAGLVAQVFAARAIHEAQVPLVGDLVLQAVVGEEMMEHHLGTTACIERGPRADAAVVGEATSPPVPLAVAPVTPGVLWCTIRVEGRATHASMRGNTLRPPSRAGEEPLGVSAVDKIVLLHGALAKLEKEWVLTKRHPLFEAGHFALLPGVILGSPKSGLVPFMVPDEGRLEVVVVSHPDDSPEIVREEVEETVRRAASKDAWLRAHPPTVEWRHHWPRSAIAADHPIVAATVHAHERAIGVPARVAGFAAVDDATWLNAAGIPAITYGPGDLRAAHAVNESVDIDEVIKATRTYALLALEWCGLV